MIASLFNLGACLAVAAGPSPALDRALAATLLPLAPRAGREAVDDGCTEATVPAFTAATDSALDLVQRLLPGCQWLVRTDSTTSNGYFANLWFVDQDPNEGGPCWGAYGATAALALLAALVAALLARPDADRIRNG